MVTVRRIFEILCIVITLAVFGGAIFIRFTHPQLTETQLFVDFWWYWLIMFGIGVASFFVVRKSVNGN